MYLRKRISRLVAAIALSSSAIVTAATNELVVWHAYRGDEKNAFEKIVKSYNERAGGGVAVKTLAVPFDAYADKISAAVPRGRGPDVFIFAQDRLGGWVEAGSIVEPIDFFLEAETVDSLLPDMMEPMTYRGIVYGLPLNYKSITLIYNKKLVESPPATTSEMVALAKMHTNTAVGRFGLAYEYSNYFFHAALMNAFGGAVFDANARPVIDQPANVEAIRLMMRWYKEDGILPADPSAALISTLFNSGNAAMVLSGPWFLAEIDDVDYGLALLPEVVEAGGESLRPWLTVEGVFVSAASVQKDAAYEFAKYLVGIDAARVLALEGRQLPTNRAVYQEPDVAADPVLAAFRAQLEKAVPMPNFAEMTLMWSPVTTAMNQIVKGSALPESALKVAQREVEKSIAALRKGH